MKIYLVQDLGENFANSLFASLINEQHLTKSIQDADVYLFCTLGLSRQQVLNIRHHPLVLQQLPKCFVAIDEDTPLPVLPGLYAALPKLRYVSLASWCRHFRTIPYFSAHNPRIKELRDTDVPLRYLFSFAGSETSGVRRKIFQLRPKRSDVLIRKTQAANFWNNFVWVHGVQKTADNTDYLDNYAREILESKFVLCPRGNGNSSYRFFESMEAGRVPVVLSDSYVFPRIPYNWDDLVIRIEEKDVDRIEEILSANEHRFARMAELNRQVYEECFADKSAFLVHCLEQLSRNKPLDSPAMYRFYLAKWLAPLQFSYRFKPFVGRTLSRLKSSIFKKMI